MDNLFISTIWLREQINSSPIGNERDIGRRVSRIKTITNNVAQVTSSFKLVDEHSGSQIGTYEDIMALYVLNVDNLVQYPISFQQVKRMLH